MNYLFLSTLNIKGQKMNLSKNLQQLIKRDGITINSLGEKTGVSPQLYITGYQEKSLEKYGE